MELIEVTDNRTAKDFLEVAVMLYKKDPNWIRPLDKDIDNIFDPHKNKLFKSGGEIIRWILKNDKNQLIGRVASFVNPAAINNNNFPTGGMGLFECIDNQDAAFMLFNACKNWLKSKGMEAMDGPINFGERNYWWGLQVEGFSPPIYGMTYNHPYYQKLFENYGFQLYYNQISFGLNVNTARPDVYYQKAAKIAVDPNYHFEHFSKKSATKNVEDFRQVYNDAWGNKHAGFREMSKEQSVSMFKKLKDVLVNDLVWLGYYKEQPIAIFMMLPDLNQYIKHVNGKFDGIGKLKFLYHKWLKTNRKLYGVVFGISPDFQGKGVEGALIMAANSHIIPQKRWDYLELSWIGDFSPKMFRIAENLGASKVKRHITYEKLFDENQPFKRYPILE